MVYVITAVHNRENITKQFVERLTKQTLKEIQLVLVDDGCTDNTVQVVKRTMKNCTIISGNGNLWWGGALHKAYKWIVENAKDEEYVMFANDDSSFPDDYIYRAIEVLKSNEKTLLAGCGISIQSGEIKDGAVVFYPQNTQFTIGIGEGNCASTRSLFCRVADVRKIGGFHPYLLPHYWSDYEWTIRACIKRGYKVVCQRNLAYYMNEESTGANNSEIISRKQAFSKRSVTNPWYKCVFILLATPPKYLCIALVNQIKRYINVRKTIRGILSR